jgi:hypothetical protein
MADEPPSYPTSSAWWKSPEPKPRRRGEATWRLIRDDHVLSCELRDESREGFGWAVIIRQDGEVSFSRPCENERLARYVADVQKQNHMKAGWVAR